MNEAPRENTGMIAVLLLMTAATGIVDAVSYLGLGHVFTANMTGNIVLMGFRLGGASGISLSRSVIALVCFMLGAVAGGRMGRRLNPRQSRISGLLGEAALLFVAAGDFFQGRRVERYQYRNARRRGGLHGDGDGSPERHCEEARSCRFNDYGSHSNDRMFGCGLRACRRQ